MKEPMQLRLIDSIEAGGGAGPDGGNPPGIRGSLNMGIDEAIVQRLADASSPPTIRFYRWKPACITIGYFQDMAAEVDLAACRNAGVDCLRRVTAGGAVFHEAELTYSIVLPLGTPLSPLDILESYSRICSGLVAGLARLGVEARFAPVNDIEAGGKKVSGNAQTRKRGCLLQHGTILLGLDPERMFSLLTVSEEKLRRKLVASAKERVTSLRELLGREVSFPEAAAAMKQGFLDAWTPLGVELEEGGLTPEEVADAELLARQKYGTEDWNMRKGKSGD
jgi:lipoate-protein ligase A